MPSFEYESEIGAAVRRELFTTQEVNGITVPRLVKMPGTNGSPPELVLRTYLQWADGTRTYVDNADFILMENGERLWLYPPMCNVASAIFHTWSREDQDDWINSTPDKSSDEMVSEVKEMLKTFVSENLTVHPDSRIDQKSIDILALYIFLTYVYNHYPSMLYLIVEYEDDKMRDRIVDILQRLVFRPFRQRVPSLENTCTTLHSNGGTLLYDVGVVYLDIDNFCSVMNAGDVRGNNVAIVYHNDWKVELFCKLNIYGPKVSFFKKPFPKKLRSLGVYMEVESMPVPKNFKPLDSKQIQKICDKLHRVALGYTVKPPFNLGDET